MNGLYENNCFNPKKKYRLYRQMYLFNLIFDCSSEKYLSFLSVPLIWLFR
jgi:hypothetical protein